MAKKSKRRSSGSVAGLVRAATAMKEDAIDIAYVGAGAGVGLVAGDLILDKVAFIRNLSPVLKVVAVGAIGLGGGLVAGSLLKDKRDGHWTKGLALGASAGLLGWAAKTALVAGMEKFMPGTAAVNGLGQMESDLLLGVGVGDNLDVQDYNPMPGQVSQIDVEQLSPTPGGGWNGLAGNVAVEDYRPIPGQVNGLASFLGG